jgi:hypothetical protein
MFLLVTVSSTDSPESPPFLESLLVSAFCTGFSLSSEFAFDCGVTILGGASDDELSSFEPEPLVSSELNSSASSSALVCFSVDASSSSEV